MNLPNDPFSYAGFKIIEDPNLTDTKEINKTWKERLFSWKPWRKTKFIQVPKREIFKMNNPHLGGEVLLMHPIMARELEEAVKEQEKRK